MRGYIGMSNILQGLNEEQLKAATSIDGAYRLIAGAGSGKTKEMLALSEANQIPLLCESEARKQRLLVKARGYGYNNVPTPLTLADLNPTVSKVYVDDIERLFEQALNVKLECLALNREGAFELVDLDQK